METGATFRGATAARIDPGAWRSVTCCTSALSVDSGCTGAIVMAALSSMAARDSGGPEAAFGLDTKRFGWAVSTGRISSGAMITRVPRLVRRHSRMASHSLSGYSRVRPGAPAEHPHAALFLTT